MEGKKNYLERYRIRQIICVILGICIALAATLLLTASRMKQVDAKVARTQESLAKEVFRFHVLANSDSDEDQAVKLKVRDAVITYMKESMDEEIEGSTDAKDTKEWAKAHLEELEQVAGSVIAREGYSYQAEAEVTTCYFPDKRYGDILFPQGDYEALRIKLGKAKGHNWWCVLYPQMCYVDAAWGEPTAEGRERLQKNLTPEEYAVVSAAEQTNKAPKIKLKIVEMWQGD